MNKIIYKLKRSSPTILTIVGVAGVIVTTVTAVRATPKAMLLIEKAEEEKGEDLTRFEVVKIAGPAYIPTVITGIATITCIFGANILNKKAQASLASAYALVDNSYKEYKKKVNELFGDDADTKVQTEIAKENIRESYIDPEEDGKMLFFDYYGIKSFRASLQDVILAERQLNNVLTSIGFASLNDFYDILGVPLTDYGYKLGWASWAVGPYGLDWTHEKVFTDDGLEFVIISAEQEPVLNYMGDIYG